jgi:hypothetical protein
MNIPIPRTPTPKSTLIIGLSLTSLILRIATPLYVYLYLCLLGMRLALR